MNGINSICRRTIGALTVVGAIVVSQPTLAIRPTSITGILNLNSPSYNEAITSGALFRAGGVMPVGDMQFKLDDGTDAGAPVDLKALRLSVENKSVFLVRGGDKYRAPMPDQWVCPLAQFVSAGRSIAYTLPPATNSSDDDLAKFGLTPANNGYIAKELTPLVNLMIRIDFSPYVESLPQDIKSQIIQKANGVGQGQKPAPSDLEGLEGGTYVNADFHIRYRAFLTKSGLVDIAGLPLRYSWSLDEARKVVVEDVETFRLPNASNKAVEPQILFFQYTALFRKFRNAKPAEYKEFVTQACQ